MAPRRTWGVRAEASASTPIMREVDRVGRMTWSGLPLHEQGGTCCIPRERSFHFGTYTAGPGLSEMETNKAICISDPATPVISFVAMEKVGEKKPGCQWAFRGTVGACTVCRRSECFIQSWLELCMSYTFCCVYATISLFRTLNHHLSTILLSPHLSHSPQTSVTSSDHQNPKKQTAKSLSLTFKAKDSPDIPWISWLQAFVFQFLNTWSSVQISLFLSLFLRLSSDPTSSRKPSQVSLAKGPLSHLNARAILSTSFVSVLHFTLHFNYWGGYCWFSPLNLWRSPRNLSYSFLYPQHL